MQKNNLFILPSKIMLLIIITLLIIIYIKYYTKYNTSYKIIQTELANSTEDIIYERYPIIISDRIVNPRQLLDTLFKYKYMFQNTFIQYGSPIPRIVFDKYTILFNNKTDIEINIISPLYKKDINQDINSANIEFVTIKLKKLQVLILPTFWIYHTELPHHVITLNDPLSLVISLTSKYINKQSNHAPSNQPPQPLDQK